MINFGFRMEWLRFAVIWLVHPDIIKGILKVLRYMFPFGALLEGSPAPLLARVAPPEDRPENAAPAVTPTCSVPILGEYSLSGGPDRSPINVNAACKKLFQDKREGGLQEQGGTPSGWCDKLPKIFIPARVESIRVNTMKTFN